MVRTVKAEVLKAKRRRNAAEAEAIAKEEAIVAKAQKLTEDSIRKASRLFGNQDVANRPQGETTPIKDVVSAIMAANPAWDPITPEGRENIMREALDQRGVNPDIVDDVLRNSQDAFDNLIKSLQDAKDLKEAIQQDRKDAKETSAAVREAKRESIAKRKMQAKVEDKAAKKTAAEDAKETADAVREARKEAMDKKMAHIRAVTKIDKDALSKIRKASRLFGTLPDGDKTSTKPKKGIGQQITDLIMSHPEFDVSDPADKRKLLEEMLRGAGYDEATVAAAAKNAVDVFNAKIEEIQQKAGATFLKGLTRGKLTQEALFKAIRLKLLDPGSDVITSLAAGAGFTGLSPSEVAEIYSVGEKARLIQSQQGRVSLLLDQMRIIYKASGIPPAWQDSLSASIRASAYGGMGSIVTNMTAPVSVGVNIFSREMAADIVANPSRTPQITVEHTLSFLNSVKEGYRSGLLALQTDATKGFSVSKDTSAAMKTMQGIIDVDALTRKFDEHLAVLKNPQSSVLAKTKATLGISWSSQRVVWKILGALDSLAITTVEHHLTEINTLRGLRKAGVEPLTAKQEFDVFYGAEKSATRHAINQLGLSPNLAAMEAQTRVENAYLDWLRDNKNFESKPIQEEALREAAHMMGNHQEVQGTLSYTTDAISQFFASSRLLGLGPAISGPVRIVGNIADAAMWYTPIYGIFRAMREKRRHTYDADKQIKPGQAGARSRFHLSAQTDNQLQRRFNEGVAGTVFFTGVLAALALQPKDDDDKWLEITAAYPAFDPNEQKRWQALKMKEYSVYLGKGPSRLGVSYTRGLFDYLSYPLAMASRFQRLLDGKTTTGATMGGMAYDAVNVAVPSITGNARNINSFQQGKDTFRDFLAFRAASFQPYSALTRSIGKLTEEPLNKDASGFQWSTAAPVAALLSDDGEIELRNALDDKVEMNTGFWQKLAAVGFPITFNTATKPSDPKLAEDFSTMNYLIPPGYTYSDFTEAVGERGTELMQQNGVGSIPELYEKTNSVRAKTFKELYADDPRPGKTAQDQRYIGEILKQGDRVAYTERMAKLWSMSTTQMKKELGLEKP